MMHRIKLMLKVIGVMIIVTALALYISKYGI